MLIKFIKLFLCTVCLFFCHGVFAQYHWVSFDENGMFVANAIVSRGEKCPELYIDSVWEHFYKKFNSAFPDIERCYFFFDRKAKNVVIGGEKMFLPSSMIHRVGIIGDTGCRGDYRQSCSSLKSWPFAKVADLLAEKDIDLVVHVGDLLYMHGKSKYDFDLCSWKHWEFEFFKPMNNLLKKAPLIMVRGNHEACCKKCWNGANFFFTPPRNQDNFCVNVEPLSILEFDNAVFFNIDSSSASDFITEQHLVKIYKQQLNVQNIINDKFNILLTHRPLYGMFSILNFGLYGNRTLRQSFNNLSCSLDLIVSGHIHLMQFLNFADSCIAQLIVGNSGAHLHRKPIMHKGNFVDNAMQVYKTFDSFGFAVLDLHRMLSFDIFSYEDKKNISCMQIYREDKDIKWQCFLDK